MIKFFATPWGFTGSMDEFAAKAKKDGYDGIEIWWPFGPEEQEALFNAIRKYQLDLGLVSGGSQSNWQEHLHHFKKMTNAAAASPVKPLYINCHSGRDHFSFEQNKAFIDHTTTVSKQSGIPISHETHRGRILYAAPVARTFMEKIPDLRITLDISHWCNVHESLLEDQGSTVEMVLQRVDHIHARVGHPQGPQVNDPRAPEWKQAVDAHFAWWDTIVERKKKNGELITVLPEFGPPDYLPTLPYTRQPVAGQWEINLYMMKRWRERYL